MGKDAPFIIGTLRLSLHVSQAQSLKDKRQVIRSLKDSLRNAFNVSVAELGELDRWQVADIGVAACGNSRAHVDEVLNKVVDRVRSFPMASLGHFDLELFSE